MNQVLQFLKTSDDFTQIRPLSLLKMKTNQQLFRLMGYPTTLDDFFPPLSISVLKVKWLETFNYVVIKALNQPLNFFVRSITVSTVCSFTITHSVSICLNIWGNLQKQVILP